MKKTIAKELGIKHFPFEIRDKSDNVIYKEWWDGFWVKRKYDSNGKVIFYENSDNFWMKWEWDLHGSVIYYESSDGDIIDNRLK